MSMDLGGAKGGVKADINVTPLVDVMLVLLIIMMLVAPLLQQGVQIRLPTASNGTDHPETQGQTTVTIAANKDLYLNAKPIREGELAPKVTEQLETQKEKVVLIKADEEVEYSAVMAGDGPVASGRHRGYRADHGQQACRLVGGRAVMAHAHHHLGADKVVTGEIPHASSDMNVTPLIDVLLVLLVIFMSTLNLTQKGVDINLPAETKKNNEQTPDISQIEVVYTADKKISINHQDVTLAMLEERLRTIFDQRKDKTMFIQADGSLRYREIVEVIDAAKGAGVDKVGIITEGMRKAAGAGN